jgi:hypothetical protein
MRLCYIGSDGVVSIVCAAPKSHIERVLGPLTDEQYMEHIIARSIPANATDIHELPEDWQAPADRTFRNAWSIGQEGSVAIDMHRARDIQRNRIRRMRKPLLAALDVEAMWAIEAQDSSALADVSRRKQKLRDAPADPRIEAAQTPEELAKILPQ